MGRSAGDPGGGQMGPLGSGASGGTPGAAPERRASERRGPERRISQTGPTGPSSGAPGVQFPGAQAAPRGLAPCSQCHGIFPAAKLAHHAGRALCTDCARKFGPLDAGASGGPVPAAAPKPSAAPNPGAPMPWAVDRSPLPPLPSDASGDLPRRPMLTGVQTAPWARPSSAPSSPSAESGAAPPDASVPAVPRVSAGSSSPGDEAPRTGEGFRPRARISPSSNALPPWASGPAAASLPVAAGASPHLGVGAVADPAHPGPSRAVAAGRRAGAAVTDAPPAGARTGLEEYADLRQQIDAGADTLEFRRRAAELASRLGYHLKSLEHYRRCTELAPDDDRVRRTYENVKRVVGDSVEAVPAPVSARRVAEEARPFWEELGDAFAYPFRGAGKGVLIVGGLLFGVGQLVASVNIYAGVLTLMLWGYIASYLFDVINTTAAGKPNPPELPEATNVLESYVFPFFSYMTCTLVAFAPFAVSVWVATKGWLPGPVVTVVLIATFALGFFVMPMTLMVRAMFQSLTEAANPALVLGSIGRIFPDYLAMFIATCLLWVGYGLCTAAAYALCWFTLGAPSADAVLVFDGVRILSWVMFTVLSWPVFLYVWMLQGHLLGRLYRQGLRRLAWFVPPTEATRSARSFSLGLGLAAGCALLLLCGAAWVGGRALQRIAANPNASAFTAKCPMKAGSALTYFWENTDGVAGLTTYQFDAAAGGHLQVVATTRIAGRAEEPLVEQVGTFDPDTGIFETARSVWGSGMVHDGRAGQHVPYFGPKRASVGATYVNDWPVSAAERWKDAWACWKVHHEPTTADLYFDVKSGVLVGARHVGVGYVVTEWLVEAKGVPDVSNGPGPNRDFSIGAAPEGGPPDGFIAVPVPFDDGR